MADQIISQQQSPTPIPVLDSFVAFRFNELEKEIHDIRSDFREMGKTYAAFNKEAELFRIAVSERLARLEIILVLVAPLVSSLMAWGMQHFLR